MVFSPVQILVSVSISSALKGSGIFFVFFDLFDFKKPIIFTTIIIHYKTINVNTKDERSLPLRVILSTGVNKINKATALPTVYRKWC